MSMFERIQKKAGYAEITGPGQHKEFDTCTCKHCNRVWVVRSTETKDVDLGGWCMQCMAMICSDCAGKPCFPFEKQIEIYEQRQRLLNNMETI